jgi:undecaprenyl diphosphate synthase
MERSLKERIIKEKVPQHVAVIMDGNGRWAQRKGNERIFGHQNAVKAIRNTAEAAAELGIKYLTLYAFSTENWNRPRTEIDALMTLFVSTIHEETKTLMKNNIRLLSIGDRDSLPGRVRKNLEKAEETTSINTGMRLIFALSYSARWEIMHAIRLIAREIENGDLTSNDLDGDMITDYLQTREIPDPELLIRTSGEYRISNFLLWQIAYAELYFTDVLWPDFTKEDFYKAICNYQQRERRFGKISEQVVTKG